MPADKNAASSSSGSEGDGPSKGPASYVPSMEKTHGQPIADWQAIIRANQGLKHMELVSLLKSEYGMGHGHANAVVSHALHEDAAG